MAKTPTIIAAIHTPKAMSLALHDHEIKKKYLNRVIDALM
jgi:hypothetical protein